MFKRIFLKNHYFGGIFFDPKTHISEKSRISKKLIPPKIEKQWGLNSTTIQNYDSIKRRTQFLDFDDKPFKNFRLSLLLHPQTWTYCGWMFWWVSSVSSPPPSNNHGHNIFKCFHPGLILSWETFAAWRWWTIKLLQVWWVVIYLLTSDEGRFL